jgi:aspartyl-tRNA(Asn)/glutamyl-tRNA(Gln) amidotransferase subunit B
MECHAELLTKSKMFCGCKNEFGGEPNTRTCPVCLGLPGTLPVFNKQAVEHVVRVALALNCQISMRTVFHRKNYFYPDLPKGYQISQYGDTPIGTDGYLEIERPDGTLKKIHITRVHLEEDTGKSIHIDGAGYSVMDYNRSGVPLMEIVTAFPPDIESAEEARLYAEALRSVLLYLNVSDGRMEQGSLRAEPNTSVRAVGSEKFGVKTELKNLNSFRAVQQGVEYEAARQWKLIQKNEPVIQATFGWNADKGESVLQRVKEQEQEYRYFPEPDLIPIEFTEAYVEGLRGTIPELPVPKKRRFVEQYGLAADAASQLVADRALADFYEEAARGAKDPKAVANLLLSDLTGLANAANLTAYETKVTAPNLRGLTDLVAGGTITLKLAKDPVLPEMFATGESAEAVIARRGIQVAGADEVANMVEAAIAANPDVVAKIKAGQDKSKGFLVGQVMKQAKGQADPADVNRLIDEALAKV